MAKVSILIPSKDELYLSKMVEDIFLQATGDVEVVIVLDGETQYSVPEESEKVKIIRKPVAEGLRPAINSAAKIATGKYIMKADSHVAFAKGFDEVLKKGHGENWITVPRRYNLDPIAWKPILNTKLDYYYLGFPWKRKWFIMGDMKWPTRDDERKDIMIDDQMTFGGTVWFMTADHFKRLGGVNSEGYGTFNVEQQELGLKTWLSGGRVVVNKNTWYAHYGEYKSRSKRLSHSPEFHAGCVYSAHYWVENKWEDRIHDFDWLVEKFWPLPHKGKRCRWERHSWPLNWRDYYNKSNE